jgi:5-methyltetrahydropteroyltriglutamate--homocysteine methyltransferase
MIKTHNLGFSRIEAKRELKFSLESFWHDNTSEINLQADGQQLLKKHWQQQASLDFVPVGDFSFYDHVLDTSFLLGNVPDRAQDNNLSELEKYFRIVHGRANNSDCCANIHAGEMTKRFDTNYHYIVPEISAETEFTLQPERLLSQLKEANNQGINAKPVLIGPVTYLWLCKTKEDSNKLNLLTSLLEKILPVYCDLLTLLADQGIEWVQLDQPILVTELTNEWRYALDNCYHSLKSCPIKILMRSRIIDMA